jgi:hypothetical protein
VYANNILPPSLRPEVHPAMRDQGDMGNASKVTTKRIGMPKTASIPRNVRRKPVPTASQQSTPQQKMLRVDTSMSTRQETPQTSMHAHTQQSGPQVIPADDLAISPITTTLAIPPNGGNTYDVSPLEDYPSQQTYPARETPESATVIENIDATTGRVTQIDQRKRNHNATFQVSQVAAVPQMPPYQAVGHSIEQSQRGTHGSEILAPSPRRTIPFKQWWQTGPQRSAEGATNSAVSHVPGPNNVGYPVTTAQALPQRCQRRAITAHSQARPGPAEIHRMTPPAERREYQATTQPRRPQGHQQRDIELLLGGRRKGNRAGDREERRSEKEKSGGWCCF